MNTRCSFDSSALSFVGSPLEQARCLLRFVQRRGNVADVPTNLPPTLTTVLSQPDTLGFTKSALRTALANRGVLEENIGGSLDDAVSRANDNDEGASPANYFVIHDTSNKLSSGQSFDPDIVNTSDWSANHLENQPAGKTHVYLSRDGKTRTDGNYHTPRRATQFELRHIGSDNPLVHKGRFLHHELVQPRIGPGDSDVDAPTPGFTLFQYERLGLCYLAASLRRGRWLIPAFHCVLDLGVGDHDDPQHFDLEQWDASLTTLLTEVRGNAAPPIDTPLLSPSLRDDPALRAVAAGRVILIATGSRVEGIGPVQDALNVLSALNPDFGIALGGNLGAFGPRTQAALRAFQVARGLLPVTGQVDSATLLALDAALRAFMDNHGADGLDFNTPASRAETTDGSGGSTTTGLHGREINVSPGVTQITAVETLTAKRDNHSLGDPKVVQQMRVTQNGVTVVSQPDYCWGAHILPNAELTEGANGLTGSDGIFTGKVTFFGKGDDQDEGTGSPLWGTVQTNSSVFGIALPRARLLSENLCVENAEGGLEITPRALSVRVEVFFAEKGRRALLPLVDIGPRLATNAAADLTVAATAFLQGVTEAQMGQLDNITVSMRLVG